MSDAMLPALYRVERMIKENEETFTLELEPAGAARKGAVFYGGQFNMLYVFGVGEIPVSISGDPRDTRRVAHTTRAVGTVTRAMRRLKRGDLVGVRGPFGNRWPLEEAEGKDVVVMAGGIGLAPLRPALVEILARRKKYRKVVLLYGARAPEDVLYREELERWSGRADIDVRVTVDRATRKWKGHVGVVTLLVPKASFDPLHTVAMVCGPEVMMRFAVQALRKRGVDGGRIYLSMERNMKCAVGFCGHCQYGPHFICKDGPVFRFSAVEWLFGKREI
ncbi:MAG: FAD/NAD(P)-binding protein [Candidatus Omnitrophica bacterium]|nr:FAD/NAD(P)-binding protein [Candidatus Omnitrophota bacterium]